jgi:hypothetical protein
MISMSSNPIDFFYALTRGRNDTARADADAVANKSAMSRSQTTNDGGCTETLNPALAMADQPGMIPTSGFFMPGNGCKVDTNSELRWGDPDAWRVKGPKQLWVRPFATTPNMGGGAPAEVDTESGLIHSMLQRSTKDNSTIMDKAIPNYYQPLIPVKQQEYSNPDNWVQDKWARGGDPTRLIQVKRVDATT